MRKTGESEIDIIIDTLLSELKRRNQSYQHFLTLLSVMDGSDILSCARLLIENYPMDLNESFKNECLHFKTFVPPAVTVNGEKKYPSGSSLLKFIRQKGFQNMLPNVDVALRLFLTMPCTNCSAHFLF